MEPSFLIIYLVLGIVVGFLAGLLGIGGGVVMVPMLTTLFIWQQFPSGQVVHMALASSMASIIVTSFASLRAHQKKGAVLWPVALSITPGILLGTFMGAFLASKISTIALAVFFAIFMSFISLQMMLNIKPKSSRDLPSTAGLSLAGFIIGSLSALVAIGGGSISVPFLTWCNVKIQKAIGTSAAISFPLSIAGSIGYLISGWGAKGTPAWSFGYVFLPAVLCISFGSYFMSPLGAQLAYKLPVNTLKKIFSVLLICLALKMLYSIYTVAG